MNTLQDKELGLIKIQINSRAKRIIARYRNGEFQITSPSEISESDLIAVVQEMKPRLLLLKEKKEERILTPESKLHTFSFDIYIKENHCANSYMTLRDGVLVISFPHQTDYKKSTVQMAIRRMIYKTLCYEAKRILPAKVDLLARQFGLGYLGLKINKSRSRWGSCSSQKNINLSYFCMLLPERLINLVILHELCHTQEMNHGDKFWKLLDEVTGGMAKKLTAELKNFNSYEI